MYSYETQKHELFTDEGQRLFIGIRDQVHEMLDTSGAVMMGHAMSLPPGTGAADSWTMMACVDRLVELGEIREITKRERGDVAGQHRVFVAAKN